MIKLCQVMKNELLILNSAFMFIDWKTPPTIKYLMNNVAAHITAVFVTLVVSSVYAALTRVQKGFQTHQCRNWCVLWHCWLHCLRAALWKGIKSYRIKTLQGIAKIRITSVVPLSPLNICVRVSFLCNNLWPFSAMRSLMSNFFWNWYLRKCCRVYFHCALIHFLAFP